MKGKVFLAWSGTKELAVQVAERLKQEGYFPIVGGEGQDLQGNRSGDFFVGATVLAQLDQCYQAIFIVQKKVSGFISSNLMFELGYALGKISPNRIHVYYIDIEESDPMIPSDLKGIWAKYYSTQQEDLVERIVRKFLLNQRTIIPDNKFMVMDAYYAQKEMIRSYPSAPVCSEYELAQYVLFFSQSAYLFDDVDQGLYTLNTLCNEIRNEHMGQELNKVIQYARCYLELFKKWQRPKDTLYLKREDMDVIRSELLRIIREVTQWKRDDFTNWFLALLYQTVNYALILSSFDPEQTTETQEKMLRASEKYARLCLECCEVLAQDNRNAQCVNLYQAYMYRNLATMYQRMEGHDKETYEMLNASFRERLELHNYCAMGDINSRLRDNFEMEYILAMAELVDFLKKELDPLVFQDYRQDCRRYVQKIKSTNRERSHYAQKIMKHLDIINEIQVDEEF